MKTKIIKLKTNIKSLTKNDVFNILKLKYNFLNKKVIDIIHFRNGNFDEGFIIQFENNTFLTAQDGEYGDNSFRVLDLKEVKEKLRKQRK